LPVERQIMNHNKGLPAHAWLCLQRDTLVNNEICALCWSKQTATFRAIQGIPARTRAECAVLHKVDKIAIDKSF
jgi:hypothetical protein